MHLEKICHLKRYCLKTENHVRQYLMYWTLLAGLINSSWIRGGLSLCLFHFLLFFICFLCLATCTFYRTFHCADTLSLVAPGFHLVSVSFCIVFLGVRCGDTNISIDVQDLQKKLENFVFKLEFATDPNTKELI